MSATVDHTGWRVGDSLPTRVHTPSTVQLFRFSAATWNPHRTHYDHPFALSEGHPGVIVHSHLHAALALQAVTSQLSGEHRLSEYTYRVVGSAYAGSELIYETTITEVSDEIIRFEVIERDADGRVCLTGSVAVAVGR